VKKRGRRRDGREKEEGSAGTAGRKRREAQRRQVRKKREAQLRQVRKKREAQRRQVKKRGGGARLRAVTAGEIYNKDRSSKRKLPLRQQQSNHQLKRSKKDVVRILQPTIAPNLCNLSHSLGACVLSLSFSRRWL
jgi:hypothetical protein